MTQPVAQRYSAAFHSAAFHSAAFLFPCLADNIAIQVQQTRAKSSLVMQASNPAPDFRLSVLPTVILLTIDHIRWAGDLFVT
jgi:hypothetical protein